jgi:hypothetical protein
VSRPTLAERFWSKVDKSGECWLWTGALASSGYGAIRVRSYVTEYAHRVALKLSGVEVPDGLFVCHHCDNPSCVNPAHLFVGTAKDNAQDMSRKGRGRKGGTHCKRGHLIAGAVNCRECQRDRNRAFVARQKAAA